MYCKDEELSDRQFPIVDEKEKMGIEHEKGKKMPALREPAFLFNYHSRLTIQDLNSDALFLLIYIRSGTDHLYYGVRSICDRRFQSKQHRLYLEAD